MTALGATTGQNATAALRAAANEEAVSAGALGLGGLIGTLGSHDDVSFVSREKPVETLSPLRRMKNPEQPDCRSDAFLLVSDDPDSGRDWRKPRKARYYTTICPVLSNRRLWKKACDSETPIPVKTSRNAFGSE